MNTRVSMAILGLATALAVAGCGGSGSSYDSPATPMQPSSLGFTSWSKQTVYAQSESGAPTDTDGLMFAFDGDDNPDAYNDLLPTT